MIRQVLQITGLTLVLTSTSLARAVASAELYQTQSYAYGRFEARVQFAPGEGVISSFFLWKPGSEVAGTFWNELDFEKLGADCRMQTNPLYGAPVVDRGEIASVPGDLCGGYHTYGFEWTPTYIAWLIDGVEVRREEGDTAAAFATNAASGMQIHFNLWPGDASFGGVFDPAILPVHQYISWVQYSSFDAGSFTFEWREDFTGPTLPSGWALGDWASPKNYSTHAPANVGWVSDIAVLSLTADDATGFAGQPPSDVASPPDAGGAGGASPGGAGPGGASAGGAGPGGAGLGGASASGAGPGGAGPGGASPGGVSSGDTGARSDGGGCDLATGRAGGGPLSAGLVAALVALAGRRRRYNP